MSNRPKLHKNLDPEVFKQFYYLKEELIAFCKQEKLQSVGSKEELNQIIMHYLKTKEKLTISKRKRVDCDTLDLNTVIPSNMRFSESNREFFKQYLGENFRFSVPFQQWLKANAGKTFQDAIDAYPNLTRNKEIDRQFEYNTYIRDFFKDNCDKTLQDAITCWKYKKSIVGHNRYEKEDLSVLLVK